MLTPYEITSMFIGQHPKSRVIQFTLTRRNMPFRDLHAATAEMVRAYDLLMGLRFHFALGTFRQVDITHEDWIYHPHLHCLLVVPGVYFSRSAYIYVQARALSAAWRVALGVDYQPIVNLEPVRSLGAWFGYLQKKRLPVAMPDIAITQFGSGLAELERQLMSQEEEHGTGNGSAIRGQLAGQQTEVDGRRGRHRLATGGASVAYPNEPT